VPKPTFGLYILGGADHWDFYFEGILMGDLVLAMFFFSMLMVPCYLATRTVRGKRSASRNIEGVRAVAETWDDEEQVAASGNVPCDRRALAVQRSREIYYRTGGRPSKPDYRRIVERRVRSDGYSQRRAS
jgi:hypothetical protein